MNKLSDALELKFDSDAGEGLTIRGYLRELMLTLWREEESFSGKRPFGNSGWQWDVYTPLVKAGFVKGTLDSDGWIETLDRKGAAAFMEKLIAEVLADVKS